MHFIENKAWAAGVKRKFTHEMWHFLVITKKCHIELVPFPLAMTEYTYR